MALLMAAVSIFCPCSNMRTSDSVNWLGAVPQSLVELELPQESGCMVHILRVLCTNGLNKCPLWYVPYVYASVLYVHVVLSLMDML